jgi:hypothetical protein
MDTIFTLGDATDESTKINLDELYERKQQQDLNTLSLYNRILARIHARIKMVSRQQTKDQHCWYIMPETIIGVPKYDYGACTAYVIDQLRENGFIVKYTHPNLLLISWATWCPSYVRNEIKKKTGIVIDGTGNRVVKNGEKEQNSDNPNELIFHRKGGADASTKPAKEYTPIETYKPSGLIYNENLLRKIEDKTRVDRI